MPPGSTTPTVVTVLVLSVVLSGCAGFPWGDSSQSPRPTATGQLAPTATPTERPTDAASPATPETTASATSSETVAGAVAACRVESAPEGATVVPASDERIDVGGPVWQAIERAVENGTATIPIEGDVFREARATLRSLPYSPGDDGLGGVYVRRDGMVVRLVLQVEV